jgi:hypothetical protein
MASAAELNPYANVRLERAWTRETFVAVKLLTP